MVVFWPTVFLWPLVFVSWDWELRCLVSKYLRLLYLLDNLFSLLTYGSLLVWGSIYLIGSFLSFLSFWMSWLVRCVSGGQHSNYWIFKNLYVCVLCMCVPTQCAQRTEALDPLKSELQVVVGCPMWLLGIELGSSARAVHALSHLSWPRTCFLIQSVTGCLLKGVSKSFKAVTEMSLPFPIFFCFYWQFVLFYLS